MEEKILKILKDTKEGLTIAELVRKLKSSRFIVRNNLFKLEWNKKIYFKKIGMAKVYFFGRKKK
jgi:hypothetical protein